MIEAARFEAWGVPGIPEVRAGDDLVELMIAAVPEPLADGDIVVVTSKIVSKADGRTRSGVNRDEAIDDEAVRTVSEWTTPRGRTRIVQTRHGFVMAAAGVDASNVETGTVVLLPVDPDASARRLRDGLRARLGVRVGVILTDTAGRVWRSGVVDMAIGAAGVVTVDDLRGSTDRYGNDLGVTEVAVADELAAATELVRTKLSGVPVAVVRGLPQLVLPDDAPDPGAAALVRPPAEDRFQMGTPEAMRAAVFARRTVRSFTPTPVEAATVRHAVRAALTAPLPPEALTPVRFVLVESRAAVGALVAAVQDQRGDVETVAALASAAFVVVPCVTGDGPDRDLTLAAAVENLLIALAADGLGAVWIFPAQVAGAAVAEAVDPPEGWTPMGLVAIGHPAQPGADHPALDLDDHIVTR